MRYRILVTGAAVVATGFALSARAQPTLTSASLSPDTTVELDQSGGGTFADETVAIDNLLGLTVPANLGTLPNNSDVNAYHELANGDQLLCFDTTVELPGPIFAQRGDVVRYDGSAYSIEFDASANGVPFGAVCDAITHDSSDRLVLSFDIGVELPDGSGGSIRANDEDGVHVDGPSSFALLDTSLLGVPSELDLDGLHIDAIGDIVVSFDTSGTVGGVAFDDEDLLRRDTTTGFWSILVDASTQDSDWIQADVDALAVPEASRLLMLASGLGILGGLRHRRSRSQGDPIGG